MLLCKAHAFVKYHPVQTRCCSRQDTPLVFRCTTTVASAITHLCPYFVAMSSADIVRSMKIKTSTLNRIHKEYVYYQKETEKEQQRVEALKSGGADAHDLRQAESVLAESSMMVPDTRQRLEAALSDLMSYMTENEHDAADSEELTAAKEAVAAVDGIFAQTA